MASATLGDDLKVKSFNFRHLRQAPKRQAVKKSPFQQGNSL